MTRLWFVPLAAVSGASPERPIAALSTLALKPVVVAATPSCG